ncbi:hypothetical protein THAOC_37600, partial [Thalassiosira oceanica]
MAESEGGEGGEGGSAKHPTCHIYYRIVSSNDNDTMTDRTCRPSPAGARPGARMLLSIAAAVAASATFGNAQEQFSTGEFKHLNGSQ